MTDHWSRWPVVVSVASGTLLTGVTLGFGLATGIGWQQFVESYSLTNMVIGLAFLASGAPVAWLTRNVVGPLLVAAGLCHLISATATMMAVFGLNADWPTSAIRALSTFSNGPWQLGIGLLFPLALLLFPDGHLPSRKWAWVAWLIVIGGAFQAVTGILADGSSFSDTAEANSILSIGLELPGSVVLIAGIASDAAYLLVIGALVWRFIRGDERTRRQLMWLTLALLIILALNFERLLTGDGPILLLLSAVLIPLALAIAIVRYELFDIRVVLSRTVLYGLTIALVIGVYVGVVAGLTLLVPSNAQRSVSVAAAIVVAFLFAPLRSLVQRMINRAFYGTRSDPARTAWQIGEGLRHDEDLPSMLEKTRSALRLPWISLRGEPDGDVIATAGTPQGIPSAELPLTYRDNPVGTLVVGLRRGERDLHNADRRTLDLIATPLAVALHATALSEQVQQARTATVEAAPPSWTPGVGLRSILERAEELGGTAAAGPTGDGWEVSARLPLDGLAASDRD